jgi:HlyD family secretion protein
VKKKTIWWIVIGLAVFLTAIVVISKNSGDDGVKIVTEKASLQTIVVTVTASGKIYPETEVKIAPEVSGEIILLNVAEGDSVKKGDVMVKINPAIYNSMVNQAAASVDQTRANASNSTDMIAQAESQYDLATKTYLRNKKLFENKVISQSEFDQAEANFKSAKATFDASKASASGGGFGIKVAQAGLIQAQENLQKTTISAPTGGIISELNVKKGERVVGTAQMAGTEMLTIADMSRMEVRVDVSETDITKVKVGDTTFIETDAYRNRKFTGVVSKVGVSSVKSATTSNVDQVTNYTVHIFILPSSYADLSAASGKGRFPFKPGMSASVEIRTKVLENTLSVPVNAVTTRDWSDSVKNLKIAANTADAIRTVVFVYNDKLKEVNMRDVKVGQQDNKYIQVTEGLKEGEQIVTAPYGAIARTLADKTKVKVVDKDKLFESKGKE